MTERDLTRERPGDVEAALAFAQRYLPPMHITAEDVEDTPHMISIPQGHQLQDLTPFYDKFRPAPRRLTGSASFTDADSFMEHVNRFKDEHSVVFADRDMSSPSLRAVYDYNITHGQPRFGEHKSTYKFPLSEEWSVWTKADKTRMGQADFAAFMENHLADLVVPPAGAKDAANILAAQMGLKIGSPADIITLSRGLQVSVKQEVVNELVLQTGEATIHYGTENKTKVEVPGMFLIGIPVLDGGERYQMAVRLRYRANDGITWWFEIYRPDVTFRDAFDAVVELVKDETKLPVWFGSSE